MDTTAIVRLEGPDYFMSISTFIYIFQIYRLVNFRFSKRVLKNTFIGKNLFMLKMKIAKHPKVFFKRT